MDFSAIQSDLTRLSILRIDSVEALMVMVGRELTARVLKIETDGQLLLALGNKKFSARTNLPLAVGDEIKLKVVQTGPSIEMQVVGGKSEPTVKNFQLATLLQALDQSLAGGSVADASRLVEAVKQWVQQKPEQIGKEQLSQLARLLQPLALSSNSLELQSALKNLLENSGIFFEAKLRTLLENFQKSPEEAIRNLSSDLKTLLGQVQKSLEKAGQPPLSKTGELDDSTAQLKAILQAVGDQKNAMAEQLLNRQNEVAYQWLKDGVFWAEFPLQLSTQQAKARVRFLTNTEKGAGGHNGRPFTVDMLLDLPNIGKMEAWGQWQGFHIQIKLYVESREVQFLFEKNLEELSRSLSKAGFTQATLEVKTDPVRLYKAKTDQEDIPAWEGSLLSIRI